MIEMLSLILGILGLVATLASLGFAYITYSNPMVRFRFYLKDVRNWHLRSSRFNDSFEYYQYSKHPEFTIEYKEEHEWEREEPWIQNIHRPDPKMHQYEVALKLNGIVIHTESFIAMDGWRYFVPVPRVAYGGTDDEADNTYYYDSTQTLVSKVIGKYHLDEYFEDFSDHAKIQLVK